MEDIIFEYLFILFGIHIIISGILGIVKKAIDPTKILFQIMLFPFGVVGRILGFIISRFSLSNEQDYKAIVAGMSCILFGTIVMVFPAAALLMEKYDLLAKGTAYDLVPIIGMIMILVFVILLVIIHKRVKSK